jgi:hypothetical protein
VIGGLDTGTVEGFAELKAEMYLNEEKNCNGRMEVVFMQRAGMEMNSDAGVGSDAVMRGSACLIARTNSSQIPARSIFNITPIIAFYSKPCLYASRTLPSLSLVANALVTVS